MRFALVKLDITDPANAMWRLVHEQFAFYVATNVVIAIANKVVWLSSRLYISKDRDLYILLKDPPTHSRWVEKNVGLLTFTPGLSTSVRPASLETTKRANQVTHTGASQ